MKIVQRITIEQVRADNPATIYYSANTCWWTHDPRHICQHPQSGLPCDPRGGMLFETHEPEEFLQRAEASPEFYGRHGLRAFMAAHHLNCIVSATDGRSTCYRTWEEYNAGIDAMDAGSEARL